MSKPLIVWLAVLMFSMVAVACSSTEAQPVLNVAGIPEQNASTLVRRYEALTSYLSEELDVEVEYVQTVDYTATVIGFRQGEIQLAWFGGLTGVQARLALPGSVAIAQRPRDANFHSKFIVQADLPAQTLEDLKGLTFTFGSESSTSGHLMPRYFLEEAGIDPETDFNGPPNYSGSHDTTWKLVESGAFQAGVLDEAVWQRATSEGSVDMTKVRELYTTPPYYDYHWTVPGNLDQTYGEGFTDRLQQALMNIGSENQEILDLFQTDSFVETNNANYQTIENVARSLGIIE
jgi:phosphonate transport system substrate-binding protein